MPNPYLRNKIRKYEIGKNIAVVLLIFLAFVAGRNFSLDIHLNLIVGLTLGAAGAIVLIIIEYFINKQISYKKGLKLEEQVTNKLNQLSIEFKSHIETDYGDLDFLIKKGDIYYGVEAKNWPGIVTFENGILKVDGWDKNYILSSLLKHCKLVRNKELGEDSSKFIQPMLIFGHKAAIHVLLNKIKFNDIDIIIATIKDFERHIK